MITLVAWLLLTWLHEWRQARVTAEQRRAAEHEAMVRALAALGTGGRRVRVRHRGSSGDWSMERTACHPPGLSQRTPTAGRGVRRGR